MPRDSLDDIRRAWRDPPAGAPIDFDEVRLRAGTFRRTIRRRNARELAACAVIVAYQAVEIWQERGQVLAQIAHSFLVLGAVYVGYHLITRGSAARQVEQPDASVPTVEYLRWHRDELERQRGLLASVPRWYIGPFVPGTVVRVAVAVIRAHETGDGMAGAIGMGVVCVLVCGGVIALNRRGARSLGERIRELDTAR